MIVTVVGVARHAQSLLPCQGSCVREWVPRGTVSAMTFNDNANVGGNTARRRGGGIALAGGGVAGLGALAVLLFNLFTGQRLLRAHPGRRHGGGGDGVRDRELRDRRRRERAATTAGWPRHPSPSTSTGRDQVRGLPAAAADHRRHVDVDAVRHGVEPDRPVLLPARRDRLRRPDVLRACCASGSTRRAGPLAQLYVLAHEYGHHVQNITGIMQDYPDNGTGPDSNGVRTELQADCFAGAWVGDMTEQVDENGVPFLAGADAAAGRATRSTPRRRSATTTSSRSPAAPSTPRAGRTARASSVSAGSRPGYSERRERLRHLRRSGGQPVNEHLDDILYPPIEPYETGELDRRRRQPRLLGAERQPRRQARRVPARRPGRGHVAVASPLLRPRALPHRAVRPARLRPLDPARERARRRPPAQHDVAPRRRHGAAAPQPRHRRWQVFGGSWGSALALAYAQTHPDARHRARAARHLHAAPPRAGVVLRGRRVGDLPRPVGGLHRADPGARARRT